MAEGRKKFGNGLCNGCNGCNGCNECQESGIRKKKNAQQEVWFPLDFKLALCRLLVAHIADVEGSSATDYVTDVTDVTDVTNVRNQESGRRKMQYNQWFQQLKTS